jgi:alkanesulfonate monooxygenase SsuD/methylene tetrahydromethanopterin reductase-like flavin-dependent oxidoreductase (luciferase family)
MLGVGLSLANRAVLYGGTTVEEVLSLAERADRSGRWHSVWVGDGLIAKPRLEGVTTLAAISARTTAVRLGVCCLATFPLRHPVLFAAEWASLDVLSAGRTQLAVCLGIPTGRGGGNYAAELRALGVHPRSRVARLEEGIEVLRKLWTSSPSSPARHHGAVTEFDDLVMEPRPVQDPCPIWLASNPDPQRLSEERFHMAIDRVAALADGWQTTVIAPEEFGARWRLVRERAAAMGRDADAMESSVHLMVHLDDDVDAARRGAKSFLDRYYGMDTPADVLERWGAYGPPEVVAERINAYLDEGLDLPILRMASNDPDGQFARVEEELLPLLDVPVAV